MTLSEVYLRLYLRLLRAAENDDPTELHTLHEQNPYLLHDGETIGGESPLHISCKHGSLQFVKEVIKLNPGLARKRNNNGFSPLHVASANAQVEIVKVLTEFDSGLCLVEDMDSKIPLHIAAITGKEDVVRALVGACPESLGRVTKSGETVLHLALKNSQCRAFVVLMEEIKKFNQEELVNRKDSQGNTVLQTATSEQLIEILELTLSRNSTNDTVVEVNSVNRRGRTPLDVHSGSGTPNETAAWEIHQVLVNGGVVEGRYSTNHKAQTSSLQLPRQESTGLTINKRNILIMVFVMTATFTFTASCNPPSKYQPPDCGDTKCPVQPEELLPKSGHIPEIFYYMMINMAGFITSIGAILVLMWPLPYRMVGTFVLIIVLIVYVLSVDMAMAPIPVKMGSSHISSTLLMWLIVLAFTLSGLAIWIAVTLYGHAYQVRGEPMKTGTTHMV